MERPNNNASHKQKLEGSEARAMEVVWGFRQLSTKIQGLRAVSGLLGCRYTTR